MDAAVTAGGGGGGAVASVFTRTGAVAAAAGDYTFPQITLTGKDIANAAYGVLATDYQIFTGTTLTANRLLTLPAATNKMQLLVSDPQNKLSTFAITVIAGSGDNVNGVTTAVTCLGVAYGQTWLESDGTHSWTMVTDSPTISITPGTYGTATTVPAIVVNAAGDITAISSVTIAAPAPVVTLVSGAVFPYTVTTAVQGFLFINGSTSTVVITLPTHALGQFYTIKNTGTTNNLTINNSAGTLQQTIIPGAFNTFIDDSTIWNIF